MDSAPTYRERLRPPRWFPVVLLLIVPATLLVFLPVSREVGIVLAILLYLGLLAAVWFGAPVIEVREGTLRAGRAQISTEHIGQVDALTGDAARSALRTGWSANDHHQISPWVPSLVRVAITDPEDPTPAWVLSSRRPQALADAISASAQAS